MQLHDGPEFYVRSPRISFRVAKTPLDMVKGAVEYAYCFRSLDDAYRLEERLRFLEASNPDKIRIAIVGAGYSGVELACKLADRLGEKRVASD